MLYDMRLLDIWRVVDPNDKVYTYYSPLHNIYGRKDLFLISYLLTWQPTAMIDS